MSHQHAIGWFSKGEEEEKTRKTKTCTEAKRQKPIKQQRGQSMLIVHGKWPCLIIVTKIVSINLQGSLLKRFLKKGTCTYSRKFHFLFLPTVSSWQVVFFRGFLLSWIIQPHLTTFQLTLRDSVSRVVVLVDSLQLDRLFVFHWNVGSRYQSYTEV